ncbi:ankyrin repeat domain-containing protein [Candidatus Dependentiae bacterium]|nr:ankyrin repeat domain-containing protein [Candidatus Dependentiae bacterium]
MQIILLTISWKLVKKGDVEKITQIINSGIDINIEDKGGWTALHWAAFYCHYNVVKALIEAGADIDKISELIID